VTTLVVDANVAAKWLLPAAGEDLLDQANHLAARHVRCELLLLAPDLIGAEIGNVLWKAVRRQRISRIEAENSLRRFTDLAIHLMPTVDLLPQALQVAVKSGRSFYDSLYVALAIATETELITADERLVNALGSRFPVRWLGAL
jgi:predicted nucleic acid-binding protein